MEIFQEYISDTLVDTPLEGSCPILEGGYFSSLESFHPALSDHCLRNGSALRSRLMPLCEHVCHFLSIFDCFRPSSHRFAGVPSSTSELGLRIFNIKNNEQRAPKGYNQRLFLEFWQKFNNPNTTIATFKITNQ